MAARKGVKSKLARPSQRNRLPSKALPQSEAHQTVAPLLGNRVSVAGPGERQEKALPRAAAPARARAAQGVQPIRRAVIAPSVTHKAAVETRRARVMRKAAVEVRRARVMRKAAVEILRAIAMRKAAVEVRRAAVMRKAVEAVVARQVHVRVNQAATRPPVAMQRALVTGRAMMINLPQRVVIHDALVIHRLPGSSLLAVRLHPHEDRLQPPQEAQRQIAKQPVAGVATRAGRSGTTVVLMPATAADAVTGDKREFSLCLITRGTKPLHAVIITSAMFTGRITKEIITGGRPSTIIAPMFRLTSYGPGRTGIIASGGRITSIGRWSM